MPGGFAGLVIGSSRRPSALISKCTSNSLVCRCTLALGVLTQPSLGSNWPSVSAGPRPTRRRPPSSTSRPSSRLTSTASRTLSARIEPSADHRRDRVALVAQVEDRLGDLLLRRSPHHVVVEEEQIHPRQAERVERVRR